MLDRAAAYAEALQMTARVYRALAVTLQEHGYEGVLVGDGCSYCSDNAWEVKSANIP